MKMFCKYDFQIFIYFISFTFLRVSSFFKFFIFAETKILTAFSSQMFKSDLRYAKSRYIIKKYQISCFLVGCIRNCLAYKLILRTQAVRGWSSILLLILYSFWFLFTHTINSGYDLAKRHCFPRSFLKLGFCMISNLNI